MTALLEIENLEVEGRPPGRGYQPIVNDISLGVDRGEVVALIGESGSGKTTVSLAALGYARPGCRISGGEVRLDGEDVLAMSFRERRRLRGRRVAYVAQSAAAAFNPARTIGDQVTESARIHRVLTPAQANARALDLYRRLDLPEPAALGRRYPHQVSGGQLQRLMAAMAMSCAPDLLVLDEPTTALDVTTQIEVLSAFKEIIREHGTAAIYVTHDLSVVAQIADRIVVMFDGGIMERGATEEIIARPRHAYTRTLMAAVRPPPKAAHHAGVGAGRRGEGARAPADEEGAAVAKPGAPEGEAALVEVRSLTAGYGRVLPSIVLRDVDLRVGRGEVVGIIGESGCGKSTLARVISGLLGPLSGEVLHSGRPLPGSVRQRGKADLRRIQIVFQMPDVAVNPRHRVHDIIGRPLDFFLGMTGDEQRRRVGELLEMVELPADFGSRYPGELSGGQKQRVNLARALAAEPELILCDEVTSSLDTVVGAAIIRLLDDLREELGIAYLFISHDLSTVASFADRIVVLYAGRVAEEGTTLDVLSPPHHPYTRLLLSSVPEMRTGWLEDVMETREALSGIARAVEITGTGCPFFKRCPLAIEGRCDREAPPVREPAPGHRIFCHREPDALGEDLIEH